MSKVHTRIVIKTDPEVKHMVDLIKRITGKSIKDNVETLIRVEYKKFEPLKGGDFYEHR